MLLARQSVNHGQMLETLTSPSNPMGNHSMPNAPVLAQDTISTTTESHPTQARMSNHTHKGWRLGGRWTAGNHRTILQRYVRILGVHGVQDALVPNLTLRCETDEAAYVRIGRVRPSSPPHCCRTGL